MRRAALFLAPVTLLTGAIFACENDPDGFTGPAFQLDGSTPGFDANQPDNNAPDAPPPPPAVTIKVVGDQGPQADVRVVFHDANGEVLETKLTGADGKATSAGALPAMASALLVRGDNHEIVTWTGLENGDELAVRALPDTGEGPSIGAFAVTTPATEGSAFAYAASGCTGEGSQIPLYRSCVQTPTTAVRVTHYGPPEFSFVKGKTVPTDGGVVPVSTDPWVAATTVTVNVTDPPAEHFRDRYFSEIADGYGYNAMEVSEGSNSYYIGQGFADALLAGFIIRTDNAADSHKRQLVAKQVAGTTTTIDIDLAQALPKIDDASVAGENVRRPEFAWTGNTTNTDGGIVRIQFNGTEEGIYRWTLVVPPGSSAVKAPALPTEAASFLPPEDASVEETYYDQYVVFVEADVLPSYKEFRQQQGSLVTLDRMNNFTAYLELPPMPVNGTFRATGWSEPLPLPPP